MSERAYLVLEDGSIYSGSAIGASRPAFGEVVFNTAMTGYQEMLTDPSYAGQLLVLTYPLIGNYGISKGAFESRGIQAAGLIVREHSTTPSHVDSVETVDEFLRRNGVPGIAGVDTRALTRRIRNAGVMMGSLAIGEPPEAALERLRQLPRYDLIDFVRQVTTEAPYPWQGEQPNQKQPHIVVLDWGLKHNILRLLHHFGCVTTTVPATTPAEEVLARQPDGIVLSPGPGNPALLEYAISTTNSLLGRLPVLGICLGHQIVAEALGARTFKLKFGHRGANHPVRDVTTGRVYITSQNHGFAVDPEQLPPSLEVTHLHLNDGTVEGMRGRDLAVLTIQYHAEASPGPRDNTYIFEEFLKMVQGG
jgi:carbamoyl-phosphate synthase small subunit